MLKNPVLREHFFRCSVIALLVLTGPFDAPAAVHRAQSCIAESPLKPLSQGHRRLTEPDLHALQQARAEIAASRACVFKQLFEEDLFLNPGQIRLTQQYLDGTILRQPTNILCLITTAFLAKSIQLLSAQSPSTNILWPILQKLITLESLQSLPDAQRVFESEHLPLPLPSLFSELAKHLKKKSPSDPIIKQFKENDVHLQNTPWTAWQKYIPLSSIQFLKEFVRKTEGRLFAAYQLSTTIHILAKEYDMEVVFIKSNDVSIQGVTFLAGLVNNKIILPLLTNPQYLQPLITNLKRICFFLQKLTLFNILFKTQLSDLPASELFLATQKSYLSAVPSYMLDTYINRLHHILFENPMSLTPLTAEHFWDLKRLSAVPPPNCTMEHDVSLFFSPTSRCCRQKKLVSSGSLKQFLRLNRSAQHAHTKAFFSLLYDTLSQCQAHFLENNITLVFCNQTFPYLQLSSNKDRPHLLFCKRNSIFPSECSALPKIKNTS